jgi:phosphatidylserine decarboxylase
MNSFAVELRTTIQIITDTNVILHMPVGAQFVKSIEVHDVDEDVAKVKVWKLILFGSVIDFVMQSVILIIGGRK